MADPSFLGTGWSFPPAFSTGGADVETVSGEEDIRHALIAKGWEYKLVDERSDRFEDQDADRCRFVEVDR